MTYTTAKRILESTTIAERAGFSEKTNDEIHVALEKQFSYYMDRAQNVVSILEQFRDARAQIAEHNAHFVK